MATRQEKIKTFEIVALVVALLAIAGGIWYAFSKKEVAEVPHDELTPETLEQKMTAPSSFVSQNLIQEALKQTSAKK